MKKKMWKAMFGVLLSMMLAVTTAALPAQAAGDTEEPCGHPSIDVTSTKTIYPNITQYQHQVAVVVTGTCRKCRENVTRIDYHGAENHSIRADGTCICGFKPYH